MTDWNPTLYLDFQKERTQPVLDLMARIELEKPSRIIDIGCGPGNSSIALKRRWPDAEVIGIDNSQNMIDRAKKDYPMIDFIVGDAQSDLTHLGKFDLVFSNAALQWMSHHEHLISGLFCMVKPGGAFAAQIPQFDKMPMDHILQEVASLPKWKDYFLRFETDMHYYPDAFYYNILAPKSLHMSIWATKYYHIMKDHQAIMDMMRSTGLKPYLERLPDAVIDSFLQDVYEKVKLVYEGQPDQKVLFPFERFFMIAYHA